MPLWFVGEAKRIESLNSADLLALLEALQRRVAELEATNAELRAENDAGATVPKPPHRFALMHFSRLENPQQLL